jgi:NADH-quinone oxidoreductase subunit H
MATLAQAPAGKRRIPVWAIIVGVVVLVAVVALIALNAGNLFNAGDAALQFIFDPNRVDPSQVVQCRQDSACSTVQAIVFSLIFFFVILTGFAYTTLLERKWIAFFQQRTGPNRVGPGGILQPAADGVKLIFKEDITPSGADKAVYLIAPLLKAVPALLLLAVVPLGPDLMIPWFNGLWYQVPLGLADPSVGVLWLLGITSIGTYGVVLAGWASNNKYAMLGGLRASAQMLSYELSLGLTMAVPVLIVSSMSLGDIIRAQTYIWEWFVFQNPLAAGILAIAFLAEISRAPFDLPEAEQELTQGFMTEYSGMKFASFMMAEYLGMIGVSIAWSALFFGGYNDGFGLVQGLPILGPLVFIGKTVLFLIVMVWIRATLPRFRYDRLMAFGWKVMLPLAIVAVMWSALAVLIADSTQSTVAYAVVSGIVFVAVVAGGVFLLRRTGDPDAAPVALEDDPIITGEPRGLGHVALQLVGGLVAIPFVLYNATISALQKLATLAPEEKPADKPAASNEKAITPTESSAD